MNGIHVVLGAVAALGTAAAVSSRRGSGSMGLTSDFLSRFPAWLVCTLAEEAVFDGLVVERVQQAWACPSRDTANEWKRRMEDETGRSCEVVVEYPSGVDFGIVPLWTLPRGRPAFAEDVRFRAGPGGLRILDRYGKPFDDEDLTDLARNAIRYERKRLMRISR